MPYVFEDKEPKRYQFEPKPTEPGTSPVSPEEAKELHYRVLNAQGFSGMYNLPLNETIDREEDLRELSYGLETKPETAWQRIKKSWEIGEKSRDLGELRFRQLDGDMSPELAQQIEDLKGAMPSREEIIRSLPERALSAAAEMLPIMLGGVEKGAKVGVGAGLAAAGTVAVAGQLGPQILAPEEIVTVPAAFGTMFSAGMGSAMLENIGRIEAGLMYDEIMDMTDEDGNPIDPRIARAASAGVGLVNMAIEMAQFKLLLKTIPGADKIVTGAVRKAVKKAALSGSIAGIVTRYMGRYGSFITKETGQELAQESVNIIGGEITKEIHEKLTEKKVPKATIDEITNRLMETATQSALAFSVMGVPGHAVGVTREIVTRERMTPEGVKRETLSEKELSEEEQEAEFDREEKSLQERLERISPRALKEELPKPWEMSPEEYAETSQSIGRRFEFGAEYDHRSLVKWAVEHDKPVPLEVLEEYKDQPWAKEVLDAYEEGLKEEPEIIEKEHAILGRMPEKPKKIEVDETTELPLNPDGTVTLYHGTTKAAEETIRKTKTIKSAAEPDVYFTTDPGGGGYGDGTVIAVKVDPRKLILDDEFPDGRKDFRIQTGKPGGTIAVDLVAKPAEEKFSLREFFPEFEGLEGPLDKAVSHMVWELESARGTQRVKTRTGFATVTEYPDWFRDRGWTKTQVLSALKRRKGTLWEQELRPIAESQIEELAQVYDIPIDEILEIPQEIRDLDKTIQKADQAVQRAIAEGKKEAIAHEKARQKELKERRDARRKLRETVQRLALSIARPAGKTIALEYREAIEHLQAGIDPSFRSSKTLEQRQRTRRYLAKYPEAIAGMPNRLLRQLNMKAVNRYTVRELVGLAKEISRLRQLGRVKRAMELNKDKRAVQADAGSLVFDLLGAEAVPEPTEPIISKKKTGLPGAWKGVRAYTLRPSRICDMLDGGKQFKGKFHRTFIDPVNKAENAKLVAQDLRRDKGHEKLDDLGLTIEDLSDTRTIDNNDFTVDKMIDVYVGWKNPLKQAALIYGNQITPELAQKIIDALTPEEKALGDWIVQEYDDNYERLRQAHIENTGEDLGSEISYTPIKRVEQTYDPLKVQIAAELTERYNLRKGYPFRGFTKERIKELPPEFQKPIKLGAYSTWVQAVNEQEHYIHYSKLVKHLHRVLGDKELSAAIKEKAGASYLEALRNYVSRVAAPNIYRSFDGIDNTSRFLRKNVALCYLGFNLVTMGKQLPSMALYLGEAGPGNLLASAWDFVQHPFEAMEFVKERDPQVKHRSIERELEELKRADAGLFSRLQKAIGKTAMVGIYAMDRAAITIGWKAVYDANVTKLGEAEAIKRAQDATLRTQPEAHPKDLAQLYAKHEAYNWLLMFTNQLNQIYNMTTHDIPSSFKEGKYYKAFLESTGVTISAAVIWMVSHRKLPEEPADFLKALGEQLVNSLPLFGREIVAATEGWKPGGPAPIEAVSTLGRLAAKGTPEAKAKALLEAIAIMSGLPYIGTKRVVEAVVEGEPSRLLGGPKKKKKTKWAKE
jgi:hypothetical protein